MMRRKENDPGASDDESWYASHVRPHFENYVRTQLRTVPRLISQPLVRLVAWLLRKGAVTASAVQTAARPMYSVSSNGPMAFTLQSYLIADTSAMVLPVSKAHQAQRSPRRKAVTVMALAISPNKVVYFRFERCSSHGFSSFRAASQIVSISWGERRISGCSRV